VVDFFVVESNSILMEGVSSSSYCPSFTLQRKANKKIPATNRLTAIRIKKTLIFPLFYVDKNIVCLKNFY
jgi:hypothetical protein